MIQGNSTVTTEWGPSATIFLEVIVYSHCSAFPSPTLSNLIQSDFHLFYFMIAFLLKVTNDFHKIKNYFHKIKSKDLVFILHYFPSAFGTVILYSLLSRLSSFDFDDPTFLWFGFSPKGMLVVSTGGSGHIMGNQYGWIFTALITIAKRWKQPYYPSMDE